MTATTPAEALRGEPDREQVNAWLTEHCGRGLPYDIAHDLDSALHGAAYTVRQIEGTLKYTVHIGQSGPASSGIRWLMDYVAHNEITKGDTFARPESPRPTREDVARVICDAMGDNPERERPFTEMYADSPYVAAIEAIRATRDAEREGG